MTGKHSRVVRQTEQLLANVRDECLMVSARKIGASDAAGKQHVASKHNDRLVLLPHEHDVSGRVSGDVPHFEPEAGCLADLSLSNGSIGRRTPEPRTHKPAEVPFPIL